MLSSTSKTSAVPDTGSAPRTLALEPDEVVVRLTTRHLFGLQQVRATVRVISAQVRLDSAGGLVGLEAELDAASFSSGSRSRDRAVASPRLLDAGRHPRLTFRSTRAVRTAGPGSAWEVLGVLTAAGVAAPTALLVTPPAEGDTRARATTRIDRYAHRVTTARGLAGRFLDVEITAEVPRIVPR